MIFLWLSPLYIAANIYYIYEICKWITAIGNAVSPKHSKVACAVTRGFKVIIALLWSLSTLAIYIGFLIPDKLVDNKVSFACIVKRLCKLIGNYHLGVFIYMGMALLVVLILRLLELLICRARGINFNRTSKRFNIRRSVLGILYVSFIVFITLFGVRSAHNIKVNPYDITIDKQVEGMDSIKLVLVADLHLGYNIGCNQMEQMVNLINQQDADIVVVAGDIFDNEYDALDDPERLALILSSIKSRYGTYAVYGNHDVSERIIGGFTFNYDDPTKGSSFEMDEFIDQCGFRLLMDEYALIDNAFYIYGRPDYEKPGKTIVSRKTPAEIIEGLDMTKPIIVVDHEPRELSELSSVGIDADLCGHTHDGQFFPMNLTSRYFTWENSAGLLIKEGMANIVTSGVGLFGPNIRIGTQAEICPITIHFD